MSHEHRHHHRHHHKHHGHYHKRDLKIVNKDCASGARGKISIVKRKDGKLCVWKRPKSHSSLYQDSYRKELIKVKLWRRFGLTKIRARWHPDKRSLLKDYVKGPTLRRFLRKHPDLFSNGSSSPAKALGEFIGLLVGSRRFIHDVKGGNMVWDGERWQLIDSGPIKGSSGHSDIVKKYKKILYEKWNGMIPNNQQDNLRLFLDKYCR